MISNVFFFFQRPSDGACRRVGACCAPGGLGVLVRRPRCAPAGRANRALAQQQQRQGAGAAEVVASCNVALALEHEAINAYQIGAESNLLHARGAAGRRRVQGHHKAHRDALVATIRQMSGTPVGEKTRQEYVQSLNAAAIRNQSDILKLAQRLERGAANAYLGVIPSFANRGPRQGRRPSSRPTRTMHYTALTQALHEALPEPALSFVSLGGSGSPSADAASGGGSRGGRLSPAADWARMPRITTNVARPATGASTRPMGR
jgi:hypothetical protein